MMKQRWGLDRNNVLRPTPGDPWGVEQYKSEMRSYKSNENIHKKEHWSKRKPTVEPRWAKQQKKVFGPNQLK